MKYYFKLGFILLIFCVVASGILAYVNSLTSPVIAQRKAAEEIQAREALIPNAEFEERQSDQGMIYYVAKAPETGEILGYTFIAADLGYSSTVQTMVGVDSEFKVLGVQIIDQGETPGLGANCTQPIFTNQFSGMTLEDIYVDKDGGVVVSLSGATITSRCIANSLREGIIDVKDEPGLGGDQ
ncbi:MAG: RnfABCDGE type electron transport complex subunit G [Candidatus Cloacimonadaceae bacterium]|jgi:electron transport complex protein RnfG|nr:RnfABCDGE type electron transport complex subunit G [Candidatus Cloacimonadota bacterium]MDY0128323.1 RnfABCDGE type electron transport complex subunit G [Candidatus Cloacimonadaceae bacterium]MCB5254256.1 RnfABCDGE type electron transport complex subunit G [Candidatus Cloacimonadota bacterium]MCK9178806.1 RnfABCDGE type electron transport complex subunit G [Candidatus Cloacimonadota bacterium]MCK9243510.1 RnfABCDGE type electron transport complex subunit G [Candidatus Cloacimonadota bacteri